MVAHGSVSVSGEINTVCVEQGRNFLDFILFFETGSYQVRALPSLSLPELGLKVYATNPARKFFKKENLVWEGDLQALPH